MRTKPARLLSLSFAAVLMVIAWSCSGVSPGAVEESSPVTKTVSTKVLDWDGGCIVFVSDRDGDEEIYVMDVDGSNVIQLTDNIAADSHPAWSPDGHRIAFVSDRDGNENIYIMDASGANVTRLTSDPGSDTTPAWSSDGRRIAFMSDRSGDAVGQEGAHTLDYDIYLVDADGTNIVRLTKGGGMIPDWSPDGSRIAFASDRNNDGYINPDIYLVDVDGSNLVQLTENPEPDVLPRWSPDGHRIAFISDASQEIYLMDPDGSNMIQLVRQPGSDLYPAWSPDGRYIAFMSTRWRDANIFLLDTGCANQLEECDANLIQLTDDPASDSQPAWRPQCAGFTDDD
jgi:TolB protein